MWAWDRGLATRVRALCVRAPGMHAGRRRGLAAAWAGRPTHVHGAPGCGMYGLVLASVASTGRQGRFITRTTDQPPAHPHACAFWPPRSCRAAGPRTTPPRPVRPRPPAHTAAQAARLQPAPRARQMLMLVRRNGKGGPGVWARGAGPCPRVRALGAWAHGLHSGLRLGLGGAWAGRAGASRPAWRTRLRYVWFSACLCGKHGPNGQVHHTSEPQI